MKTKGCLVRPMARAIIKKINKIDPVKVGGRAWIIKKIFALCLYAKDSQKNFARKTLSNRTQLTKNTIFVGRWFQ